MRATMTEHSTKLWLSAKDTYEWAHRADAGWPCSTISNKRVSAEFNNYGDLVNLTINGRYGQDIDGHEFTAITSDFLRERFGPDHPAVRS